MCHVSGHLRQAIKCRKRQHAKISVFKATPIKIRRGCTPGYSTGIRSQFSCTWCLFFSLRSWVLCYRNGFAYECVGFGHCHSLSSWHFVAQFSPTNFAPCRRGITFVATSMLLRVKVRSATVSNTMILKYRCFWSSLFAS